MEKINYSQIYTKFTKGLSPKTQDIFDRRFGVTTSSKSKLGKGQTVKIENQIVKIKMESRIQSQTVKIENQIVKIKMENQNPTGKMAKTENHQNQIVKMLKI
jgi:hypothetical protein